jgi:peptidoglycan/xylan/chitin deacetylase (PgdA/CDA1 family)
MMPVVLLYHDVVDGDDNASGFPGGGAARYKLGRTEFAAHLDAIAVAVSFPPADLAGLAAAAPRSDRGTLLLTFDDGGLSAATVITCELERRGWRGHFFITVDYIGQHGFVDREQIRELARRGHGIGTHSCSHPTRMAACSRPQLLDEWRRSCQTLAEILGAPVSSASVPGGYYSRAVASAAAEAGVSHLFTSEPTTRTTEVDGCRVFGRYTVYRGMTAPMAAALAAGAPSALFKQAATWKLKKAFKAVGGRAYLGMRRALLERAYRCPKS